MPMPSEDKPSRSERNIKRLAKRWIAGDTLEQAVTRAKELNKVGIRGVINFLEEHGESVSKIKGTVREYMLLLDRIAEGKVQASVSVKPTQLGMTIDRKLCMDSFAKLLDRAKMNTFVWVDMERSEYVQATLDLYKALRSKYDNVGVTVQAYLKRSAKDLDDLLAINGKVRLCKGAYKEISSMIVGQHEQVSRNYARLTQSLFERGNNFAIATHDNILIEKAKVLSRRYKKDFEFQFLMGVGEKLKIKLVQEGFAVANYIPYGRRWLEYVLRRLR
ncbi:MAG: proline dehydrogenase [Thaumarchaeota archaeon]|nr:proline dehydrogenase [Nitrososphaerota archaeon]